MPEFAQFVALQQKTDTAFRLGEGVSEAGRTFKFDLPDLDPKRTVILMFKVSGTDGAGLKMTLNPDLGPNPGSAGPTIDFELDTTFARPRSWHEIESGNRFKSSDNHLIVEGPIPGFGMFVAISDIVILYHAKTT
jgi:hypothetical protein